MKKGSPIRPNRRLLRNKALGGLICAVSLLMPLSSYSAPLSAGSVMPPLIFNDQHDMPLPFAPETHWVVFAAEKPVSDMVSAVLAAEPAGVIDRLRLVYVVDLSGMPGLVTQMFAIPKLREMPFSIALVRDRGQLSQIVDIPRTPGSATVLRLESGQVRHVSMARHAAELRSLLGLTTKPATP